MSAPQTSTRHARRPCVRRGTLVLAGTLTSLLMAAGAAYSAWSAQTTSGGGMVTAGDLSVTAGTPSWKQVTPGVDHPASGTLDETPTDFFSMPGDVVEIDVPVTVHLVGDNFSGGFSVTCTEALGEVDATFYVQDSTGHRVTRDGEMGETLVVPGLTGSDQGVTTQWFVVITVNVISDYRWTVPSAVDPSAGWSVETIDITLEQVREGAGYVDGGG